MSSEYVKEIIERGELEELKRYLNSLDVVALLETFEELEGAEMVIAFRMISKDQAVELFDALSVGKQAELVNQFDKDEVVEYFKSLDLDDRAKLFEELPARVTKRLVNKLDPRSRECINILLNFPEDSAGRAMNPRYLSGKEGLTVGDMLQRIRQSPLRADEMDMLYVIDAGRKYKGHIRLGTLLKESPETPISELSVMAEVFVRTLDDRERARDLMMDWDLPALPVLDSEDRLVGSLTFDDVMDLAEEEATEDFQKLSAVYTVESPVINIKEAGLNVLYRARIPWLLVLVGMNIFSGAGIAYYEETIEAAVALVFFLPLLIDSGGNAGTQSATLTVRAMATGDVKMRDWAGMLSKELQIALLLGVTMAVAVSLLGFYRGGMEIAVVVSMTMVCVVLIGSLVGMTLPYLASKIGFDPATASGPLVTSIADILGVLVYFSIATWYLGL